MNLAWGNNDKRKVTPDELAKRLFYFSGSILAREFERYETSVNKKASDTGSLDDYIIQETVNELPYFCWYATRILLMQHHPENMEQIQDSFTELLIKEISVLEGEMLSRYEIAARNIQQQSDGDESFENEQVIRAAAHVATLHIFGPDITKDEYELHMKSLSEQFHPYLLAINDFLHEYELVQS